MTLLFSCLALCCWSLLVLVVLVDVDVEAYTPEFRGKCRLFLDTANEEEWDELLRTRMFHGVTTNPSLLHQVHQPCTVENLNRLARKAFQYWSVNEFMCQTWGRTVKELYDTGIALSAPERDRIIVKVPVTLMGVQAATKLIESGCRVCLTAALDRKQALIAVSIGAEYIAPYLGRMNDAGKNGMEECLAMKDIVYGTQGKTRILVASLGNDLNAMAELAGNEMNTFTLSPQLARDLLNVEPLTDKVAAEFEKAAAAAGHTTPPSSSSTTTKGDEKDRDDQ
ncbi:hypothetical protein ACA910_017029 [Epithemia clementina (nom. ined.)]